MSRVVRTETVGGVEVTLTRTALGQVADYTVSKGGTYVGCKGTKKEGLRLYTRTVRQVEAATRTKREFRYIVGGVDLAGVPWDVAYCKTPIDALRILNARTNGRTIHFFAYDGDDPEAGYFADLDDEIVTRYLDGLTDSEFADLAQRFLKVNFHDGEYENGQLRRDPILDALYEATA